MYLLYCRPIFLSRQYAKSSTVTMASNLGKKCSFRRVVLSSLHAKHSSRHVATLLRRALFPSRRVVVSSRRIVVSSRRVVVSSRRVVVSSRRLGFSSHCLLVLQLSSACIVIQFSLCLYISQAIARDRLCCLSSLSFSAFLGWLRLPACLIQLSVAKSPGLPLVLFSSGVQSAGLKPSHTAPD